MGTADAYLRAIEAEQWDVARGALCAPLRAAYVSGTNVERRIRAEARLLPSEHTILGERDTGGGHRRVRYSVGGQNWGGGPYEMTLVGEDGEWKPCGAGLEGGVLGYLLMP